ncbi:MAG: DUF2809 domain-containing protein [Candidatus Sumerlaeota bacterium]|nr:DUF2809 domain-containing protein [Candidatus Sumerlaeota bacterium]
MRPWFLLCLLIVTPIGFATKFYSGPGSDWSRDYAGGLLYEVFWILLVLAVWTRFRPAAVAGVVFVATSGLEFLQLWKPPSVQAIRGTFLGRTLIGTTFCWGDFPYYAVGCVMAVLIIRWVRLRV